MSQSAPRSTRPRPRPVSVPAVHPLPVDDTAERAVLCALLLAPERVELFEPDWFNSIPNRRVAEAASFLLASGKKVDAITVACALKESGCLNRIGGSPFIRELFDASPDIGNVRDHLEIVRRNAMARKLAETYTTADGMLRNGRDPTEVAAFVEREHGHADSGCEGPEVLGPSDIFARLPPTPWAIRGLSLCPGAPSLFAGYGYSGKSIALQAMALQVAASSPVWGTFAAQQGACIHLDYEQGEHLTRQRYQRLAWALDIAPQDLGDRLQLICHPRFYLDEAKAESVMTRLCTGKVLAIIDSFRAACRSTDENSSEARVPLDMLGRVSERTGCAIVVIHHARKPTKDSATGARDAIRGSSALYDACGSVFVLEGEPERPDRTMHHVKARVSGKTLEPMTLRIEDAGDPGTDGAPAGLSVVASKAPSADEREKQALSARFEQLRNEIRGAFDDTKERRGGVDAISKAIGRKAADVRRVVNVMTEEGELVAIGNSSTTKGFRLVG